MVSTTRSEIASMPGSSAAGTCLRQTSSHRPRNENDRLTLGRQEHLDHPRVDERAREASVRAPHDERAVELLRLEVDVAAGDRAHRLADQALPLHGELGERRSDVGHAAREAVVGPPRLAVALRRLVVVPVVEGAERSAIVVVAPEDVLDAATVAPGEGLELHTHAVEGVRLGVVQPGLRRDRLDVDVAVQSTVGLHQSLQGDEHHDAPEDEEPDRGAIPLGRRGEREHRCRG